MQSHDERDREGFAARKERERDGVVKEFGGDEITGRYEGEELEARRAGRPPDERFGRLISPAAPLKAVRRPLTCPDSALTSDRVSLFSAFSSSRTSLTSRFSSSCLFSKGQKEALTELIGLVKTSVNTSTERDHVSFTARVDVDKAHELAKVEVTRAEGLAKVEVTKEEGLDNVQAKKDRRATIAKIAGGLLGGGSLVELLHQLGVL